jgi:hypothetical protein
MEENLRGFLVDFHLEHYMEHFTNISKYWKSIWKQFWFHGDNFNGTKHIMSISKLHSIHVELQKFKGTTSIHAPHICLQSLQSFPRCMQYLMVHLKKI